MTEETKANKPKKPVSKISLPKGWCAIRGIGEKFYDSSAGNGPVGPGWSLSVPAISRKTEKCN